MSSKHLSIGSQQPPKVEGKVRLYSMQFCPYAERVRLVLIRKNIPHDIVNVDLKKKPDWIFKLHPEGKVPVLDAGRIVVESIDICDYLDELYADPPLHSKNEGQRHKDKDFVKYCDGLIALYYKAIHKQDDLLFEEYMHKMTPFVLKIENELQTRGTTYFGGEEPGMVDYMLWPWGERAGMLTLCFKEELPDETVYPHIYSWCRAMRTRKEVEETVTSIDRLYQLTYQYINTPNAVQYDLI